MRLRICDGDRERITPATVELMEEGFAGPSFSGVVGFYLSGRGHVAGRPDSSC